MTESTQINQTTPACKKCSQFEQENKALKEKLAATQRRLKITIAEWQRLDRQTRDDLNADVICDFISTFYHHELTQFLRKKGFKYKTWSEISTVLSDEFFNGDTALKDECCKIADFTHTEWDALYDYKRTRNMRVHPRRSKAIVNRIMDEMSEASTLKNALHKMFSVLELTC